MKHIYILFFLSGLISMAQPPAGYYDPANGLSGYALKSALESVIDDVNDGNGQPFHDISVTYGQLWDLYETSDDRPDGTVWDMYSNCVFNFVVDQDMGLGGNIECEFFNREHTFPRSWFNDNTSHPIYADPFHVIPSDKKVNAERGNLAFGEVAVASFTSSNNSKVGTSSISGPTGNVFEPADEYKGDIARGFFYLAVRYQDDIGSWEANDTDGDSMLDGSSEKVFEQWALDMLYTWHVNDPVSQKEIDRNNDIFAHQDNRNPFIDNPQYVEDIWQSTLSMETADLIESIRIYPNPAQYDLINVQSTNDLDVIILNSIGQRILETKIYSGTGTIHIPGLKPGLYLVRMTSQQGTVTKRLIRQ
ncbi:MAG: endonuclease [Bacteroidia bacterium]|nr:endonuclease [Bacteroidia bacterium]